MNYLRLITGGLCVLLQFSAIAQSKTSVKPALSPNGLKSFPELVFTKIPGAPQLSAPQLITGREKPVLSEGFGVASPAIYDWDGDGIKDLLIGEFGSGLEKNAFTGNFIRVFKNEGSNEAPVYSGNWQYAWAPESIFNLGTPYSISQFCCMGFSPQFIDMDGDGMTDMLSGNYYGEIILFKGTKNGFELGRSVPQKYDPRSREEGWEKKIPYWLYSSASFADFNGDGLPDVVTGGHALRLALSSKTAGGIRLGERDSLYGTDNKVLKVYSYNADELTYWAAAKQAFGDEQPASGDQKLSPTVVDWDNDGVLDLLVTNAYSHEGLSVIDFFKGVKTAKGLRFEKPVALFTAKNGGKAFPGACPRLTVADYNNDGIMDLLIGASVETVKGQISNRLAWEWEDDNKLHGPGKGPGYLQLTGEGLARHKKYLTEGGHVAPGMSVEDFLTIRHAGYVYVLPGKK